MVDNELIEEFKKTVATSNEITTVDKTHEQTDNLPLQAEFDEKSSISIIESQRQKDLTEIENSKEFQQNSMELNAREVVSKMTEKAIEIEDKELTNEFERYKLKKKKEELDYQIKCEKNLIKEKVKSQVYEQKRLIAERRYGYLYKTEDITILNDNGDRVTKTIYKDFTPSKTINRAKEISNWYKNLSNEVQKMITTTCKFILRLGLWGALGGAIYGLVMWILNSGIAV